ncbi:KH domain-containing protein [Candidatus Saccharibacteria bacterium]|nr:KH domain-containing protein [Candidatus Saccharibacteria bacterium]
MATIDQQFVEYIVKTLVNNPDKVSIDRTIDEKGVLLSLEVDPEDVGRIIGRRGATAQSIRTLLRALGTKNDARYNLKIVNNDDFNPGEKKEVASISSDDDAEEDAPEAPAAEEIDEVEDADDEPTASSSELAEKTRAELADLDDLDI